jgi:uncharacterized protein
MLLLDLARIRKSQDRFEQVYAPEEIPVDGDAFTVTAPVALTFDIFKDGDRFRLAGRVATTLTLTCGRCLEGFVLPVDAAFDLQYVPGVAPAADGESEIEADDLGTAYYDDEKIDLGQLVQEQFYLALPMKPLCGETCRGLCPQCGANLNRGDCGCSPKWVDPRFAALGALRKDS